MLSVTGTPFTVDCVAPTSPEAAFAFICDLSKWPLFTGYGPLPGIVEATVEGDVCLGARIRVTNTDGSVHHEVVERFEPGHRYTIRMELNPPVSYVMASIAEDVELTAVEGGTRIRRTFTVKPRSWLTAPIAWFFGGVLLPRAVARHNERVMAAVR